MLALLFAGIAMSTCGSAESVSQKSYGGDVHVGGLLDWLMVSPWVCDDQKPWLLKVLLDLICEGSCNEAPSEVDRSSLC